MDKKVDVIKKYEHEVLNIKNKLNQLENGRVYEINNAKMDGYLAKNIEQLRDMLADLLYKIEYGEESFGEELKREYRRLDFQG